MRTSKTVGGVKHNYYYVQGKLMYEDCPSYKLFYTYDANGFLSGIKRILANGATENYGVHCNIFGDVISIYYEDGMLAATYTYDSWGKLLSVTETFGADVMGDNDIWTQNSIRYRGYVYDEETQLYYLQSRYYDPNTCRFINADGMLTATNDFTINLFAYAACNPLVNIDPEGTCPYNGSMGDFRRLEMGLPSMDCNCSLSKTISTINDGVGVAVDSSVDLFLYSLINESRPDYWPIKSYNNYITSAVQTTYNVSEIVNNVGLGVSSCCVFIEAIEGVYYNSSHGASNEKIVWDIIIDLSFGTASIFASTATATAVGAFVGTYIPIPIVGTVIGAAAGYGVSYIIDYSATKVKSIRKK